MNIFMGKLDTYNYGLLSCDAKLSSTNVSEESVAFILKAEVPVL
jgi:hypothetical protein